ncbi:MAG: YggS family pyridoxal phosphate-dependent enzyme [Ilumatobacteraceae bacterium]
MELSAPAIRERISAVSEQIAAATSRPVDLVVVTKTHPQEVVLAVAEAGARFVGENYAQEVRDKASALEAVRASGVSVQFIGQLQTNKVRMIAGLVDCVASVDRASLVDEIAKRMPSTRIHLQVNATGETSKGGCLPDALPELITRARDQGLYVDGLMAVGPTSAREDETRAAFRCVDELASEHDLPIRNYGMSGDLNIAIEQGSTMVRVGSAILGNRNE